ncbi:hypothetical protein ABT154_09610 [Streptomyces sp. NPDC001728]|uniref:hypothetical protein n=1 Tax=Streptomyces sp. NPDC001728 TaxID=3154396 RepID=UPI003318AEE4
MRGALDADGPDADLLLALARAHMAEDDDDHDDDAERVLREGLDDVPDDIGLIAGHAELCARTDALDRPGRHARGPVLLARLREIAPDSPTLLEVEAAGTSVSPSARNPARSAAHRACRDDQSSRRLRPDLVARAAPRPRVPLRSRRGRRLADRPAHHRPAGGALRRGDRSGTAARAATGRP